MKDILKAWIYSLVIIVVFILIYTTIEVYFSEGVAESFLWFSLGGLIYQLTYLKLEQSKD